MTEKEKIDEKAIHTNNKSNGGWRFDYMNDEVIELLMRLGINKDTYEVFIIDVFEDKKTFIEEHLNGDTSIVDRYSDDNEMFYNNYQIGVYWIDRHQNETNYGFKYPFVAFFHQRERRDERTNIVSFDD